ncbi:hypothetical protein PVAP13_5NG336484 [Panicum virgatum]|uniref:Uncharacterized protein n=1 Tax=Panicum virgatum TaxID=38727 RepID=A0A8T0RWD7_PANVG|nr:hypothetical protein PVAP13_5NG336484 [Panicum virgatum]
MFNQYSAGDHRSKTQVRRRPLSIAPCPSLPPPPLSIRCVCWTFFSRRVRSDSRRRQPHASICFHRVRVDPFSSGCGGGGGSSIADTAQIDRSVAALELSSFTRRT